MRLTPRILRTMFLLAAAVQPASAQGAHFAAQFGISAPLSDLKTAVVNPGMSVGIMVPVDFGGGHFLRPRLDYSGFNITGLGAYGRANTLWAGADYLIHVSGKAQGLYFLAGLGYQDSHFSDSGGYGGVGYDGEKKYYGSGGAPSFAAGLGWQFTGLFGMEVRYTASRPSVETEARFYARPPSIRDEKVNVNAVNLSFTFTWGR